MKISASKWLSSGTPFVWLNAGAVAISILMVVGLLGLLTARGMAHFWPTDVMQANYAPPVAFGSVMTTEVLGEKVETESVSSIQIASSGIPVEETIPYYDRELVKLGNRDVTGADDKRRAKTIYEFPLWKRFFGRKEGSGLKTDAYELYGDVNEVITTANSLRKQGRIEELNAYLASRQHILDLKSPIYNVKKQLDRVRDQKRRITGSDMDAEVKTQMMEDLDAQLNEYLQVIPKLKDLIDAPFIQTTF